LKKAQVFFKLILALSGDRNLCPVYNSEVIVGLQSWGRGQTLLKAVVVKLLHNITSDAGTNLHCLSLNLLQNRF